jgi:hypothetical protein
MEVPGACLMIAEIGIQSNWIVVVGVPNRQRCRWLSSRPAPCKDHELAGTVSRERMGGMDQGSNVSEVGRPTRRGKPQLHLGVAGSGGNTVVERRKTVLPLIGERSSITDQWCCRSLSLSFIFGHLSEVNHRLDAVP